jgi:transcriptional activator SPT7
LRELGIAAEFGLSSLTIPKRLLKGKKNAKGSNAAYGVSFSHTIRCSNAFFYPSAKSVEPPPPYPPPLPFVSLTAGSVKNQIGLLRVYFEHRLTGLDSLPDDSPNPAQAKLGPLGQVIRPSSAAIAAAAGSKKKSKPKDAAAAAATVAPGTSATTLATVGTNVAGTASTAGITMGAAMGMMSPATPVLSPQTASVSIVVSATSAAVAATPSAETQSTPKKKKAAGAGLGGAGAGAAAAAGAGGGGTGKKRGRPPEGLPPVVVASA